MAKQEPWSLDPAQFDVWQESAKKLAGSFIDLSEHLAKQALTYAEKSNAWVKETPLAPALEFQSNFCHKLIDNSVSLARTLWRLDAKSSQL